MQFVAVKAKIWWNNKGSSFSETRCTTMHSTFLRFFDSMHEVKLVPHFSVLHFPVLHISTLEI